MCALIEHGGGRRVKFQLLPSTFEEDGSPSARQHLACLVVNDRVAIDAGSLAMAATDLQRRTIRDIVLTHAHLDHIAGLPLFIDDLFATLTSPLRIYALAEVIEILERDVFNWSVFPRFSELTNAGSPIVEYHTIRLGEAFKVAELTLTPTGADHKVPSSGFMVSDGTSQVGITGDSATLGNLRESVSGLSNLNAVLVECAFPNEFAELAGISHHMTPATLARELTELRPTCPVFVINIKPSYRDAVVSQLLELRIPGLELMTVGKVYYW